MRKLLLVIAIAFAVVQRSFAPPVTKNKTDDEHSDKENEVEEKEEMEDVVEYHRYLKEVIQALESDPEFRSKLENAQEADIRSGKIAHELEFVGHQVRSKLDELKRQELERLRHLAVKEYELENGLDPSRLKIDSHITNYNPNTFEVDDLKKLIAKTTQDLAEADKKRRKDFKEYEMQKKFEQEQKMKGMDEKQRKDYEEELHKLQQKHMQHQPLHHPGSKQQLEEVWEKQDLMDGQDFDPKTFFYLHDLDSNGVWDENEVKTLFLKELDKMYAQGAPEDDLRERVEEMERMREHVFKEADINGDGLISWLEFLEQTKKPEFQKDPGWEPLDQQQLYSTQEYEAFERRRQEEIQKLIAQGVLSPHSGNYDPGHHPQQQYQPQQHQQQQFPSQFANVPQSGPNQGFAPPMDPRVLNHGQQAQFQGGQQHYEQVPQQQYHGQMPQPQYHGQAPPQQYQGQAPPQQYQGQAPPQQYQGQAPPQQYQGQAPPQQYQGQVPHQPYQGHAQSQYQGQKEQVPQQPPYQPKVQTNISQQQNTQQSAPQQQQELKNELDQNQIPIAGSVPKGPEQIAVNSIPSGTKV
ncbi:nucleobindin-2 isoform X2 [Orussus abietinus]|uniref:nucleobindin-2 isoform X2 n=1 Tax=Orussus abietinus TaxID=222816 RepID=UPI000626326C|nr:nucleobindin-2 isoform X2 [Orussus abietinus]